MKDGGSMADAIKFERQGGKVVITVDLTAALAGRLSTGRPGAHGDAKLEHGGQPVRINLNVMQAGKVSQSISL